MNEKSLISVIKSLIGFNKSLGSVIKYINLVSPSTSTKFVITNYNQIKLNTV